MGFNIFWWREQLRSSYEKFYACRISYINVRCCSFLVPDVSTVFVGVNFRECAFRQQTFSCGMGELSRDGSPSKIIIQNTSRIIIQNKMGTTSGQIPSKMKLHIFFRCTYSRSKKETNSVNNWVGQTMTSLTVGEPRALKFIFWYKLECSSHSMQKFFHKIPCSVFRNLRYLCETENQLVAQHLFFND